MKIVTIVGARPQFIKAAPLCRELRKRDEEILVHTGQHYNPMLSQVFFAELGLPIPDHNLNVGSGTHGEQTGKMLMRIEDVLSLEEPEVVIVYGDTNSTLAGALAAVKLQIPTAHIEAGLRSYDRCMPEEINRVVTDHTSSLLFCPSQRAVDNLKKEGIEDGVYLVGDVMLDALQDNIKIAEKRSHILEYYDLGEETYLLATVHRAENTDEGDRLQAIFEALSSLSERVIIPLHPRTEKRLRGFRLYDRFKRVPNLTIIPPVGYLDMLVLTKNARMLLTDSGGLQKEAYFLETPCITLRDRTEWVETVEDGWNILVSADKEAIIEAVRIFQPQGRTRALYGDGKASQKVCEILHTIDIKFK